MERKKLEEIEQRKKQAAEAKAKEKRSVKESWKKFFCLRWSQLDKKDAWNMFVTTVTIGCGGDMLYSFATHQVRINAYRRRVMQQNNRNSQSQTNSSSPPSQPQPQCQYQDPRPPAVLTRRNIVATDEECSICMDEIAEVVDEINQLPCGTENQPHRFCTDCLRGHINNALRELRLPKCPHAGCDTHLSERHVKLVTNNNPQVIQRFDEATRRSISSSLAENEQAIFCPGANCIMHWVIERGTRLTMTCAQCQTRFCTGCQHNHDQRITCQEAEQSENDNWIQNHTRPCPSCNANIERNDGCNHMTCGSCYAHFCWTCGARAIDGRSRLVCDSYTCRTENRQVWG